MTDLTDFLLARIAETEEAMGRIQGRRFYACDDGHVQEPAVADDWGDPLPGDDWDRLPNHHNSWAPVLDPSRVLGECEAKRRIVDRYVKVKGQRQDGDLDEALTLRWVLDQFALAHADHEDYRQDWKP